MVIAFRKPVNQVNKCPRCGSSFVAWDKQEKEPYCCLCGWRRAIRITAEQAKDHFRCEREFWSNLFATENDPDDQTNHLP